MKQFETITIYHRENTPDGIVWTQAMHPAAFVHFRHQSAEYISDRTISNTATVRVFIDKSICYVGDLLCFGEIKAETPPDDALVITEVTENFKGSQDMWHIKIKAR